MLRFYVLFLLPFSLFGQSDTFTDKRDQRTYTVIRLDSLYWMRENLRYAANGSYATEPYAKAAVNDKGNFYGYRQLADVCPADWHVATFADWRAGLDEVREMRGIVPEALVTKSNWLGEKDLLYLKDTTEQWRLLDPDNPLGLTASGWIQGKKHQEIGTATYWAAHPNDPDPRYHLHVSTGAYVYHTHTHHIDDKARRVRRFTVRCVRGLKE